MKQNKTGRNRKKQETEEKTGINRPKQEETEGKKQEEGLPWYQEDVP